MKKLVAFAFAAALMAGSAFAVDCGLPKPCIDPCAPPCPPPKPKFKWVEVTETVKCEVPVTEYVDEPCEVKVTTMCPVEEEVEVCVGKWVFEPKKVPYTKQVVECEEYTVNTYKTEYKTETRTRKVPKKVCETVEKEVVKTVYDEECDPCTGKIKKVARKVCETIQVPVTKTIYEEEEYCVQVPVKVCVPVVKTRQVCKSIKLEKEVLSPKYVYQTQKKKVTKMVPTVETKTVMRKKAVKTTKIVEKQVVKKVKVPADDC